ncbi:plasmid stabilization protein [Myroides profundi]|nr:plasmid stabilization protein [Myroides profundi]
MLIKRSGNKSDITKIENIFEELQSNPEVGIGNPEKLKHELSGFWSRRLNSKDRIIYKIDELSVIVMIVSAKGHYFDK